MSKVTEDRVRRQLAKHGLILKKCRGRIHADNLGEYMVVDLRNNSVVVGAKYDCSLEEIGEMIRKGRL